MKLAPLAALLALSAGACSLPAPIYPPGDSHPACAAAPVAQTIVNPDALVDSPASRDTADGGGGGNATAADPSAHQGHQHHQGHGGYSQ